MAVRGVANLENFRRASFFSAALACVLHAATLSFSFAQDEGGDTAESAETSSAGTGNEAENSEASGGASDTGESSNGEETQESAEGSETSSSSDSTEELPETVVQSVSPVSVTQAVSPLPPVTPENFLEPTIEPIVSDTLEVPFLRQTASAATLTSAPLDEIPLSIAVIPEDLIDSQQIFNLREALELNGSVVRDSIPNRNSDTYIIRGFALDGSGNVAFLVNGVPVVSPDAPPADISALDRIEILKGATGLHYGSAEPGGVINFVYKEPLDYERYFISQSVGSYGRYRGEFDATGPLTEKIDYRYTLGWEDSDSYIDFDFYEKQAHTLQFKWTPSDATEVRFIGEYREVASNPLAQNAYVRPDTGEILTFPENRYLGFSNDFDDQTQLAFQLQVEHEINDSLKNLFQAGIIDGGRQSGNSGYLGAAPVEGGGGTGFNPVTGDVSRLVFDQERVAESFYFGDHFIQELEFDSHSHEISLGGNFSSSRVRNTNGFSVLVPPPFGGLNVVPSVNLFNPVTTEYPHLTRYDSSPPFSINEWRIRNYGGTLQDQITIPELDLHLMLGVRYAATEFESLKDTTHTGEIDENPFQAFKGHAWLPRVGGVFDVTETASVFTSYAESFVAPFSLNLPEDPKPETGDQVEVGLRNSYLDGRLSSSFTYFELVKRNVVQATIDPEVAVQVGEQESHGLEFDLAGAVTDSWNVYFSWAYVNTETLEATPESGLTVGDRFDGVPLHNSSFWTTYTIPSGPLEGLGFGYGLQYRDDITGGGITDFSIPSYVIHNAAVFYETETELGKMNFSLNIRNIADTLYIQPSGFDIALRRGDPLTVEFTAGLEF
ncbi:MAG: TonB-dependent siderophore receptor [Verrucomicrobiota bacterium]